MFDAIGRRGNIKPLSSSRWIASAGIGALLLGICVLLYDVVNSGPTAKAQPTSEDPDFTFLRTGSALPPPNLPPPPRATTRPKAKVITRKTVETIIKEPDPTPLPRSLEKVAALTPTPSAEQGDGTGERSDIGLLGSPVQQVINSVSHIGSDTEVGVQVLDITKVKIARHLTPEYPRTAANQHIEDTVYMLVTCSADGKVKKVQWESGNPLFRDAAEEAVMQWEFAPQPMAFQVRVPVKFTLKSR